MGKNVFEFTLRASSSFGWVPEYIGWHDPRDEYCETCCIKDMLECASILIDAGYEQYFGVIDRFGRNQLKENQIIDTDFVQQGEGEDTYDTTYRDIAGRVRGGFSGGSEPNSISIRRFRSLAGCCAATGPEAFYLIWNKIIEERSEGIFINLAMDRSSSWVDVISHYPDEGRVELLIKNARDIYFRLPEWADTRVTVSKNDLLIPLLWHKSCLYFPALQKGDRIVISHNMPHYTKEELVRGMQMTVEWRGNTVLSLFPEGDPLQLYQRKGKVKKAASSTPAPTR